MAKLDSEILDTEAEKTEETQKEEATAMKEEPKPREKFNEELKKKLHVNKKLLSL